MKKKNLTRRTKAAPDGVPNDDALPSMEAAEEKDHMPEDSPEEKLEKIGAQAMRRFYEDQKARFTDYDQFIQLNENERVGKWLGSKMEQIESDLTEVEDMFGKEYPDYPPLGEAATKETDLEEEEEDFEEEVAEEEIEGKQSPEPDDSELEEEEEPLDAVEGMQTKRGKLVGAKSLGGRSMKILRKAYKRKSQDTEKKEDGEKKDIDSHEQPKEEKRFKQLAEEDLAQVGEAAKFCKEIGEDPNLNLDDERREKAGHWYKTLDSISQFEEKAEEMNEPANAENNPEEIPGDMKGLAIVGAKALAEKQAKDIEEMKASLHRLMGK